jgi:hypothetical protein
VIFVLVLKVPSGHALQRDEDKWDQFFGGSRVAGADFLQQPGYFMGVRSWVHEDTSMPCSSVLLKIPGIRALDANLRAVMFSVKTI